MNRSTNFANSSNVTSFADNRLGVKIMKFIKNHSYPCILILLILCILLTLINFHTQLSDYTNVLSAMMGALVGSMGPYVIGLQSQKNEYKKAKRRFTRLLQYTHSVFNDENVEEYLKTPLENTAIGKVIYDDQWSNYLSFLDRDLSDDEINIIVQWFDRIFILENSDIDRYVYKATLTDLQKKSEDIEAIIKKLKTISIS